MSRDLSTGVSDALEDDVIYPFTAVELQFDGDNVVRLWTGVGTLVFEGQSWTGAGELLDISSIEETSDISAKGATVTLSGVPSSVLSLALSEPYQGRVGKIYLGLLTVRYLQKESESYILQQDGSRIELEEQETTLTEVFSGFMDRMTIDEQAESSTIGLSLENKLVTLERPRIARYSHEFQRTLDSTDKGLEYVESLQLKEFVWGPNG
jgi:hypothetical protein